MCLLITSFYHVMGEMAKREGGGKQFPKNMLGVIYERHLRAEWELLLILSKVQKVRKWQCWRVCHLSLGQDVEQFSRSGRSSSPRYQSLKVGTNHTTLTCLSRPGYVYKLHPKLQDNNWRRRQAEPLPKMVVQNKEKIKQISTEEIFHFYLCQVTYLCKTFISSFM